MRIPVCLLIVGLVLQRVPPLLGFPHPFDPLSADEIETVGLLVRLTHPLDDYDFITITLLEPPKPIMHLVLALNRRAQAVIVNRGSGRASEITVNILKKIVEKVVLLPKGVQPMLSGRENSRIAPAVLSDPGVRRRLDKLGIPPERIVSVNWVGSGCGEHAPEFCGRRLALAHLYFESFEGDNYLPHPLNFYPVVDVNTLEVLSIEEYPTFANYSLAKVTDPSIIPRKSTNYYPGLQPKDFYREDVKPLRSESDGGPSFKISDGYRLDWQGFRMRLGWSSRTGLVLHNITYKSKGERRRPLIYRASLSEMVVTYGDPRPSFPRKVSIDIGEYFANAEVISLIKGVDCSLQSRLIDVYINNGTGHAQKIPRAICISEVDGGILHRHYEHRYKRGTAIRAQHLVVEFSMNLGNYDYSFQYIFHQDASMDIKVGATGLLNTVMMVGKGTPWGTMVSKNVMAQYHQHLFCFRLDTDFDGGINSVYTQDVHLMQDDPELNPFGNGLFTKNTLLTTSLNSVTDARPMHQRIWKILNPNTKNPVTGSMRGYKLIPNNMPVLMATPSSLVGKRVGFAKHSTWVLPYDQDELYAAGNYPNQNEDTDGVAKWVKRNESIVAKDIVIFHTFGFTHIPTTDEFPIMRIESTQISLRPCNFFDHYEGLNVPPQPE